MQKVTQAIFDTSNNTTWRDKTDENICESFTKISLQKIFRSLQDKFQVHVVIFLLTLVNFQIILMKVFRSYAPEKEFLKIKILGK
jgi:hypothetical protein